MSTKSEKCIKYAKLWIAILVFLYVLVYSANRTLLIYKCRIYEVKASLSDVIYSGGNINSTSDNKCKFDETINISDGANNGTHIIFDEVAYSPKDYYEDAGKTYGCICNVRACIKPCCIQSERYESTPISVYREDKFVRDVNFSHFHKLNCSLHNPEKTYELDPNSFGCQQFHVQEDGRIYIPTRSAYKDQPMFCIRNVGNRYVVDEIARSFVNLSELFKFKVFGRMATIPFLLVTLLVYALLPEKRNLAGKCLMGYVATLALSFICETHRYASKTIGPFTMVWVTLGVFFQLASHFWMNIMCIDIWLNFSGRKSKICNENKLFIFYNIHAYLIPIILSIFIALGSDDFSDYLTKYNDNNINVVVTDWYWFSNGYVTLKFFYGPITVLLTFNIIIFIDTALTIKKIKSQTKILNKNGSSVHSNHKNQQLEFVLYVKLLMIMGVHWEIKMILWIVNFYFSNVPHLVWFVADIWCCLYGIFIFFHYVFDMRTFAMLRNKYIPEKWNVKRKVSKATSDTQITTVENGSQEMCDNPTNKICILVTKLKTLKTNKTSL